MLGYVLIDRRAALDALLADVAAVLEDEGLGLAGAVQENPAAPEPGARCDMYLRVLGAGTRVCISQRLGAEARGCRLDPQGLATAAGMVEAALADAPALVIVNKFGATEASGRGFRPAIAQAVSLGIPVLTGLTEVARPEFERFAEGLATPVEPERAAILHWCRTAAAG